MGGGGGCETSGERVGNGNADSNNKTGTVRTILCISCSLRFFPVYLKILS